MLLCFPRPAAVFFVGLFEGCFCLRRRDPLLVGKPGFEPLVMGLVGMVMADVGMCQNTGAPW